MTISNFLLWSRLFMFSKISYRSILYFLLFAFIFTLIAFSFQPFTENFQGHVRIRPYVLWAGLLLGLVWTRVHRSLHFLLRYAVIALLYILPLYLPHMLRSASKLPTIMEPTNAMVLSASLYSILALFALLPSSKNFWLKKFMSFIYFIFSFFIIWAPLQFIGYSLISGGQILSSSYLLAVLETHPKEVSAYLSNQNIILWITGFLAMILIIVLALWRGERLRTNCHSYQIPFSPVPLLITAILMIFGGYLTVKASVYQPIQALQDAKSTLEQYKEYRLETTKRQERLQHLKGLSILPQAKGVYVLVIGESETRDHMGVYGYDRPTTPWLSSMAESDKALIFKHPYSNHTHTVPTLTYALNQKNQYNEIPLTDSYSIIEMANAAGYDTWWISLKKKFGIWDTPVSEAAFTAKHQTWLDPYTNLDNAAVNAMPDKVNGPTLIVLHLMGCHSNYKDRYPGPGQYPTEGLSKDEARFNAYDNAVLYSDKVLRDIYEKAVRLPDFQGMVFMPDHGEDCASNKSHESKYYEPVMSRIPFIVFPSPLQEKDRPDLYHTLVSHEDSYWTNDLLYDFMISYLGIENAPNQDPTLDLASPKYRLGQNDIMTLHGTRHPEN
jgi:heptose-I-phosphate ethanolaminephosphotransferase